MLSCLGQENSEHHRFCANELYGPRWSPPDRGKASPRLPGHRIDSGVSVALREAHVDLGFLRNLLVKNDLDRTLPGHFVSKAAETLGCCCLHMANTAPRKRFVRKTSRSPQDAQNGRGGIGVPAKAE